MLLNFESNKFACIVFTFDPVLHIFLQVWVFNRLILHGDNARSVEDSLECASGAATGYGSVGIKVG